MTTLTDLMTSIFSLLGPSAEGGLPLCAVIVATSRLPLLNGVALAAASLFLGAILATGRGGVDEGMAVSVAGVVSALILLICGAPLWRRPSLHLRALVLRHSETPEKPLAEPIQSIGFRLVAVAILALSALMLAPLVALPTEPAQVQQALWLAFMGLFAALSPGGSIVSGAGLVMTISAFSLLIPEVVVSMEQRPQAMGAIACLMIIAALGFGLSSAMHSRTLMAESGTLSQ
jgi:hypothetical protein